MNQTPKTSNNQEFESLRGIEASVPRFARFALHRRHDAILLDYDKMPVVGAVLLRRCLCVRPTAAGRMRSDQRCYAAPAWGRRADHRFGRIINANIAEYHVPVNADVHEIKVIFVEEPDDSNPLGVKGLGEIGIVGVAAAIANAVYHATGKRVRDLPITLDKLQL